VALEIDIKANDDFEKSALKISAALDHIAQDEEKINALSKKLGVSNKQIAAGQKIAANLAAIEIKKNDESAAAKIKKEEEFNDKLKLGVEGIAAFGVAAIGAVAATYELGKSIAELAYEADAAEKGSAALVRAYSGDAGDSVINQLDEQAKALGETVVDVRNQFVKYREAGVTNQVADAIIKTRADLIAMKVPASEADKAIQKVLDAGHNSQMARQQLGFISAAFGGVGDGAKAAKYALTSVSAAQAQIHDDVEKKLADVWKRIGPDIGEAAHRLADFVEKLLDSEEGKEAIDGLVKSFKTLADAVTSENIITGFNAIRAVADAVETVFHSVGEAIGFVASEIADFLGDAKLEDLLNPIAFLEKKAVGLGSSIVSGLVEGITGSKNAANDTAADLAHGVGASFAGAAKIQSPSKVFEGYGQNIVQGLAAGQEKEIASKPMPVDALASEEPKVSTKAETSERAEPKATPIVQQAAQAPSGGGRNITIENLVVQSNGKPEDIARSIRQEMQLLLRAGSLSRGMAA
jgi:hypothetical protein